MSQTNKTKVPIGINETFGLFEFRLFHFPKGKWFVSLGVDRTYGKSIGHKPFKTKAEAVRWIKKATREFDKKLNYELRIESDDSIEQKVLKMVWYLMSKLTDKKE